MQFGTPTNPAAVCINPKTDAVQVDYYALKCNAIRTAELKTIIHLELYGDLLKHEISPDIMRHLVKFKELETLSLIAAAPPPQKLHPTDDFYTLTVSYNNSVYGVIMDRVLGLATNMENRRYNTWKKPLLNQLHERQDGSRFAREGEFIPAWCLGVDSIYSPDDFAKSTMACRLEESKRNRT